MKSVKIVGLVVLAGVALSGCESTRNAMGLNKVVPDEFRVVTKAPLVVPPNFALRPPAPGEPRPQELQPDSAARQALLGQRDAVARTPGEQLFVAQAGAERADPLARYVVDDEFGDLAYKDESFSDKVLFWRKKEDAAPVNTNTQIASEVTPLDADAEKARLDALTGGQAIVITQKKDQKFKLPGL